MTTLQPLPDRSDEHMLGPATRMLWRAPDVVHFEMGSAATVVEGLPLQVVRNLAAPAHGPVPHPEAEAPEAQVRHALTALTRAGYLWRRPPIDPFSRDDRLAPPAPRLAGELTALAARHGEDAVEILRARRRAVVVVAGTSRIAVHIAALLAASGVGRVSSLGDGTVRLHQAMPGGASPADEGFAFAAAAHRAVRAAAPEADTSAPSPFERPDLTILAGDGPVADERRAALHAAGAAHLVAGVGIDHGVVGPLVLPGLTSCLRCADLHRRDRDPAWCALTAQLAIARRHGPVSDVTVATIIAGSATLQALTYLDGGEPAVLDATIELRLPDWRLRRRSWPLHPDCDCVDSADDAES